MVAVVSSSTVILELEIELEPSKRSNDDDRRHAVVVAESVASWAARSRWVRRAQIKRLEMPGQVWRSNLLDWSSKLSGRIFGTPEEE